MQCSFAQGRRQPRRSFIVLTAVVLVVAPIWITLGLARVHALSRAEAELANIAKIGANVLQMAAASVNADFERVLRLADFEPSPSTQELLQDIVYINPIILEAAIIDLDGRLVYSTAPHFDGPFAVPPETRADPAIDGPQLIGRLRSGIMRADAFLVAMAVEGMGEINFLLAPDLLTLAFQKLDLGRGGRVVFANADGQALVAAHDGPASDMVDLTAPPPGRLRVVLPALADRFRVIVEADRAWALRNWQATALLAVPVTLAGGVLAAVGSARVLDQRRRSLDDDLRLGIERQELIVEYQPIIDLDSGACVAAEALVRWQHPVHGLLAPPTFLPIAVASGLMGDLTAAVLARVAADYPTLSSAVEGLQVNLNCPHQLLLDGSMVAMLGSQGAERPEALPPTRLVVEITEETFAGADAPALGRMMDRMRHQGVRFALDDFGTGYASLSTVKDIRFDYLKIDRAFVQTASTGAPGTLVLDTLVELAAKLGAKAIAEGIETPAQVRYVRSIGVTHGQGWLFAASLSPERFVAFVRAGGALGAGAGGPDRA